MNSIYQKATLNLETFNTNACLIYIFNSGMRYRWPVSTFLQLLCTCKASLPFYHHIQSHHSVWRAKISHIGYTNQTCENSLLVICYFIFGTHLDFQEHVPYVLSKWGGFHTMPICPKEIFFLALPSQAASYRFLLLSNCSFFLDMLSEKTGTFIFQENVCSLHKLQWHSWKKKPVWLFCVMLVFHFNKLF